MKRWMAMTLVTGMGACGDGAPKHYYVLCEDRDASGWSLIDQQRDSNGYILACTYRSPDRQRSYTVRCRETGCD